VLRLFGPAQDTSAGADRGDRWWAGLDQYQVRGEEAWYRHVTLAMVAYAFLTTKVWTSGGLLSELQTDRDRVDRHAGSAAGRASSEAQILPA
jgi:hypothetical protein